MAMAPAGGGGTGGGGSGFKLVFKLGKLGNPSAPTTAAPAPPAAPAPAPAPVTVQHQSPPPVVAPPQPVTSVHQSVALPRSDPVLPDPHPQFNSQKQHPAPTHASAPSVKTKAVSPHASVTPRQPPPPTPSSSTVPSQGSMLPPPPPIQSLPPHFSLFKAPKPRDEDREPDGSDERRVSAAKYRQLKRKYDNTLEVSFFSMFQLVRTQLPKRPDERGKGSSNARRSQIAHSPSHFLPLFLLCPTRPNKTLPRPSFELRDS
ncbi:hypothetical protein T439DRAFT_137989 [Meredithblackwellia eburnea MCA 4105]